MESNFNVPQPFAPAMKLAQSNMSLLAEFWFSPEMVWLPFFGSQRLFSQAPAGTGGNGGNASDAWSRLVKGLMQNYSRFFVEAAQGGMAAWSPQAATGANAS